MKGGIVMEQMISNLGFPIAGVIGMSGVLVFLIKYLIERDKQHREDINRILEHQREDSNIDREMYKETIDNFNCKLDKFALALESNNNRLENIECDIRNIKEKVGE
jgi:hypothetical protein